MQVIEFPLFLLLLAVTRFRKLWVALLFIYTMSHDTSLLPLWMRGSLFGLLIFFGIATMPSLKHEH